jgi:hypothetical protein
VAKPTGGLRRWFKEDWVDIGSPKKDGGFKKCGRKSTTESKRKYPKCVPKSTAQSMSKSQIKSAVTRKRSKKQGWAESQLMLKLLQKKTKNKVS